MLAALLSLGALATTSACGFKSSGLADDAPACATGDCGTTDSGFDGPIDDAPVEDTPVPPGTVVEGDFVGAAVSGNADGIELRGSIHWSAAVHGSSAGITLEGTLQ